MINVKRKKRDFDSLAKAAKTAGLIAAGEVTDFGTSVALGAVKTLQESTWEKKALVGGLIGNIAASVLDMDLPFANLGIESMAGIDAFVDNASDVAMGIAGVSLAYKMANNIQEINSSNKSIEELIAEMGLELEEEKKEKPIIQNKKVGIFSNLTPEKLAEIERLRKGDDKEEENEEDEEEMTEEQEMALLKSLLKKYGKNLKTEEIL